MSTGQRTCSCVRMTSHPRPISGARFDSSQVFMWVETIPVPGVFLFRGGDQVSDYGLLSKKFPS